MPLLVEYHNHCFLEIHGQKYGENSVVSNGSRLIL